MCVYLLNSQSRVLEFRVQFGVTVRIGVRIRVGFRIRVERRLRLEVGVRVHSYSHTRQ